MPSPTMAHQATHDALFAGGRELHGHMPRNMGSIHISSGWAPPCIYIGLRPGPTLVIRACA